jgi:hypothetical protein
MFLQYLAHQFVAQFESHPNQIDMILGQIVPV